MGNLGNVCICGSPFVMSRTDAQNGLYRIFNLIHCMWASSGTRADSPPYKHPLKCKSMTGLIMHISSYEKLMIE